MAVISSHLMPESFAGLVVREEKQPAAPTGQGAIISHQASAAGRGRYCRALPSHACRPDKTLHRGTELNVSIGHNLLRKRNPVQEGSAPDVTRPPSLRPQQRFEPQE
jgi:hypothetical protein